ncbi:neuronal acetylcholine receptor subunit alpha-10-like isoform X2 [Watersipora subatra]|uniref:neuronal acetylcholine receptor subunit alpha-10-like isoform X2 n=1 Tax=Watersipora subatra TaxID=2589382 RepID=UPI00355C8BAB
MHLELVFLFILSKHFTGAFVHPTHSLDELKALSAEKRLIKDLIATYRQAGVIGRPVRNTSEPITISFGLALIQIMKLDEKNQVLTISTWSRYWWHDYLLQWNESEYNGVTTVAVPAKEIWLPDIVLYNYADDRLDEKREAMAVIQSDGYVLWIPPAIFKSSCSIDITNFPFDSQVCNLKFGVWTSDGFKIDLAFYQDLPAIDLTNYVASNEWDVIGHPARKNIIRYPCCAAPYPDLTFTLIVRRQVAFYSYILILPCVLLSLLTMVLFWLPPESPAKMQLGMNIFVAFFLLLLLLTENTPPAASSIPLIGAYYCLNMIMITLSTFLAVIVIHLYFRGDRTNRVPTWLRKTVLVSLARLLCMSNYVPKEKSCVYEGLKSEDPRLKKEFKRMRIKELKYNKYQIKEVNSANINACSCNSNGNVPVKGAYSKNNIGSAPNDLSPDMSPLHLHQSLEGDVREIKRYIKTIIYRQKQKETSDKIRAEWRAVALVLDRMFFFLYVLSIIVSLATMFPRAA